MILPKDLNRLILQYVESPRIPDLLYQCWKEQLEYGHIDAPGNQGYCFSTKSTFQIQPADPRGRTILAGGWTFHMVFTIERLTLDDFEVIYKFDIEVVWLLRGHGMSVFHVEYDEDVSVFPLPFSLKETMPRAIKDVPSFFVGHVFKIEVETSRYPRENITPCQESLYHGGFSFDAIAMLDVVESLTPEDLLV
jgi:hypothetical protein